MALGSQVCFAPRVGTAGHCIVSRIGCPSGGDKLKVFISYARRDTAAADALVAALQSREFEALIDRRSLPFGDEWQAELYILSCDRLTALPFGPADIAGRLRGLVRICLTRDERDRLSDGGGWLKPGQGRSARTTRDDSASADGRQRSPPQG